MHSKRVSLSDAPQYLMIVFQRYGKYGRKNNCHVSFSSTLNIGGFADKDLLKGKSLEYTLKGVANHSGNMNFGHYYA